MGWKESILILIIFKNLWYFFQPDESLIKLSLFAVCYVLNFFPTFLQNLFQKNKPTNFELKSHTPWLIFARKKFCICFYFTVLTVTVLLFLHFNHWCLRSLQRNPLSDWQTSTYDHLSMRTAGLNYIRKTAIKNVRELTTGIFSFF